MSEAWYVLQKSVEIQEFHPIHVRGICLLIPKSTLIGIFLMSNQTVCLLSGNASTDIGQPNRCSLINNAPSFELFI